MAVNKPEDQAAQQANQGQHHHAEPSASGPFAKSAQKQTPSMDTYSYREMGSRNRRGMSRNQAGEVLMKAKSALKEVYTKSADRSFMIDLLSLDMGVIPDLAVSAIVLAVRDSTTSQNDVAFHVIILEGSAATVPPQIQNINNVPTEIIMPVTQAYDDLMNAKVRELVGKEYPGANLLDAAAVVLPAKFPLEGPGAADALYSFAAMALTACTTELETHDPSWKDFSLANVKRDEKLNVEMTFKNPETEGVDGQPIRSDIQIKFSAQSLDNRNSQMGIVRQQQISKVSAFLDLLWNPEPSAQPVQIWGQAPQAVPPSRKYQARLIMTQLDSEELTPATQLLALVTAAAITDNHAWVHALSPKSFLKKGETDIHNIGAVGYEMGFGGQSDMVDTSNFSPRDQLMLVQTAIRPELIFSLDVSDCGPDTWFQSVFALAALGSIEANNYLLSVADHLTGGRFSHNFNKNANGSRVMLAEVDMVHLGTYEDKNHGTRDLREIDYLAALNIMGKNSPDSVKDWSDTFLYLSQDWRVRMSTRKKLISAMTADTAVFTGFAKRVTFDPEFLRALISSCVEAGLDMRLNSPYADQVTFERATGASFTQAGVGQGLAGSMFSRSYNQQNMNGSQQSRFGAGYGGRVFG